MLKNALATVMVKEDAKTVNASVKKASLVLHVISWPVLMTALTPMETVSLTELANAKPASWEKTAALNFA